MPTNTLTVKQSRFVVEHLKDGNASRAYRDSYAAEDMSARAIQVEASRLLMHPDVALSVRVQQEKLAARLDITFDGIVTMLLADREFAYDRKNPSAAIAATMGLARVTGFMAEDRRNVKAPLADIGTEQLLALEQLLADTAGGDATRIH